MRKNNTKQQQTKKTKSRKTEKQSKIKNNLDKILTADCNFFFAAANDKNKTKTRKIQQKKRIVFYSFCFLLFPLPHLFFRHFVASLCYFCVYCDFLSLLLFCNLLSLLFCFVFVRNRLPFILLYL